MDEKELVLDPGKARIADLIKEFQECSPETGAWNRLVDADQTRFALWENQSRDGRKHSSRDFEAKPWDGASDQRELLADDIIDDDVAILTSAFQRSLVRAEGTNPDDAAAAAVANRMLLWFIRNKLNQDLAREVELSAQYLRTYGWCVLLPTWDRQYALRQLQITVEDIVGVAPSLESVLMDPAQDDVLMPQLRQLFESYIAQEFREQPLDEPLTLAPSAVKAALKQLRKLEPAVLELPYVCRDQPAVRALRPYQDVFIPDEQGDLQTGRVYVRELLREEQIRALELTQEWDADWVTEVVKLKGRTSKWVYEPANATVVRSGAALRSNGAWSADIDTQSELIEVVTCYSWRLNASKIPGIYVTVFSPHLTKKPGEDVELYARHGLLAFEHGKMPFAVGASEWWCRSLTSSRGVPERAWPLQRLMKVQQDALIDRTSLTTLPPRLVPPRMMESEDEFGPASKIPIMRGEEPRFMELPGNDGVAQGILQYAETRADQRFGRLSPNVLPARMQVKQQRMVNAFLGMWTEVFQQWWALILQYLPSQEFERISGMPKPKVTARDIHGEYTLMLQSDVREQDLDFAVKQLEAVSKYVLPEDAAGVIDRTQLIRMKLMAINPLLAQQLMVSNSSASQKLFEQVSADIASMFLGNPPRYVEKDPTAQSQLQFAMQIVQANPNYQAALQQGGRFAEAMQSWAQNRTQAATQEKNKTVGRIGVEPMQ